MAPEDLAALLLAEAEGAPDLATVRALVAGARALLASRNADRGEEPGTVGRTA